MGSTLSSNRLSARRRRKTTSAANVDYHELNGNDVTDRLMTSSQQSTVKVGRAKRASRLLAALIGRKSAAVATLPVDADVISGNGAHCWHQANNDSGYNEVRLLCRIFHSGVCLFTRLLATSRKTANNNFTEVVSLNK